jgi:hypothetical protein
VWASLGGGEARQMGVVAYVKRGTESPFVHHLSVSGCHYGNIKLRSGSV